MSRKLRMGMIGGSLDAFIGAIHRKAAALDGEIELVCGAFSSDPAKSRETGKRLYLNSSRVYDNYAQMLEAESSLPADERMDFVSIVTPNHVHFEPAQRALQQGFHVIIDKPITFSLQEAKSLKKIVDRSGLLLALIHTYTGYPLVKEARHAVASGRIGRIRKVYVEYTQGWLASSLEKQGNKQASWRTDPARSGIGGAIGDIGTHAANLAEYITNSKIAEVNADVNIVVKGRRLDDDTSMLFRMDNGASGVLVATQVAAGEENNLTIRVYGDKGGLEWCQEDPNTLTFKYPDRPKEIVRAGWSYLSPEAMRQTRTPAGHPEGYLEAFANIYTSFARAIRDHSRGKKIKTSVYDFPDVDDGVRGLAFVEAVVKSGASSRKWTKVKY